MEFDYSERTNELAARLTAFMDEHVIPNESRYYEEVRALENMCRRTLTRVAFGKPVAEQTVTLERIAESRVLIDQARLLRIADGPDEVHRNQIGKLELSKCKARPGAASGVQTAAG